MFEVIWVKDVVGKEAVVAVVVLLLLFIGAGVEGKGRFSDTVSKGYSV